jgi:pimeloyl-ACP methyl ester carboxylesterase
VILVHGGVGPELTWEMQEPLAERWTLVIPWRRGFEPSPAAERQDFELDARDIGALLAGEGGAHLVGLSYGAVGSVLAAAADPTRVRSLTVLEPALFGLARDNATVRDLERLSRSALRGAPDGDPAREEFFAVAGLGGPERLEHRRDVERIARGLRFPGEAEPDGEPIIRAGIPRLVVSGGHHPGLEEMCDEVARSLDADRERVPGAGHAVARAPGFNERLEPFLSRAEAATGSRGSSRPPTA